MLLTANFVVQTGNYRDMVNYVDLCNQLGFDEAINGQVNFELENYQSHPTIKAPLSN